MRLRLPRSAIAMAGLSVAGLLPVAGLGQAAAAMPSASGPPPAAHVLRGSPASSPGRGVLLINGDSVSAAGESGPRGGLAGSVLTLGTGGQAYEIPAAALPYLGRGLNPSLFNVSLLAREETGGRLPVRIGYRGHAPTVPGVAVTSAVGGVARGYLTAASAREFGTALVRQYVADHARGSYGQDGMFAGGVTVSLADVAAPARAASGKAAPPRPGYVMRTLTVEGTNLAGHADTGDVALVFNVDSSSLFDDPVESTNVFYDGSAKFSVPTGHYWAIGDFIDINSGGTPVAEHLAILPQFSVSENTVVRMAERAADSEVTMVTPRPATVAATAFEVRRIPRTGPTVYGYWEEPGAFPLWISPTHVPPTAGRLQTFTDQWLYSPAGTAAPYEYVLVYQGTGGTVPEQRRVIPAASLATVDARYYSAVPSTGALEQMGEFPAQYGDFMIPPGQWLDQPRQQTEYLTGNPAITWNEDMAEFAWNPLVGWSGGQYQFSLSAFRAGERTVEDWNRYPLHAGVNVSLANGTYRPAWMSVLPSATRAGNELRLDVTPFTDNQPGHSGFGFDVDPNATVSGGYEIDENGGKIAGGNITSGKWLSFDTQAALSPKTSVIRFELDASRTGADYPLSTSSQTVWTWRSAHEAGGTLPAGWTCQPYLTTRVVTRDCAVEPMMTLRYAVPGMGLDGRAAAGQQVLEVSAAHIQLAKAAAVTGATVQVSLDGGQTWHDAQVTGRAGSYRAAFSAPAGSFVTLRVSAADAVGGQITETITRAYAIVPAATRVSASPQARAACPAVRPGYARCLVEFMARPGTSSALGPRAALATAEPAGWGAKDIEAAYKLPTSRGAGQTVAVVDAYDTPNLEADLASYRRQYGLPACTTANGCFLKVNQNGQAAPLPASGLGSGWDVETTLDAEMVSAACPRCKIRVVEADTTSLSDIAAAENAAARLGAQVISNSYGARENGYAMTEAGAYDHPGHTIVASSGDYGFTAANFPADLANVTAVGGTELARAANSRGWNETVWKTGAGASGSGCSAYVPKPAWQHDPDCSTRTIADVSAVAWNVAIYESTYGGWMTVGGTSAASPLIAGVYALAGNAASAKPGYEYSHAKSLFDVTVGNNNAFGTDGGAVCGYSYLCTAKKGYDAPTGLGTPDGPGAF